MICMYHKMTTTISLIDIHLHISITIHCYNVFLVMKNFKINLLAKFQIHDSLSLTIVSMLFHPHGLFNL